MTDLGSEFSPGVTNLRVRPEASVLTIKIVVTDVWENQTVNSLTFISNSYVLTLVATVLCCVIIEMQTHLFGVLPAIRTNLIIDKLCL